LRTVVKPIQRELLARTSWSSSTSAKSSRIRLIDRSSDSPGDHDRSAYSAKPAFSHTAEVISTMKVLPVASNG
jgi:hypothetical protein